jgi:hypothetical protein
MPKGSARSPDSPTSAPPGTGIRLFVGKPLQFVATG